ncbi:unnamed protein product [Prorocentrum cordatum]|uniref:Transmembrane protein 231 n=1 Tax=Prorocentrum cordatum TaxID=2364126 RepID=A0ABN9SJK5_9DINO|nr:unnamed protein product [Polarella glacialis]
MVVGTAGFIIECPFILSFSCSWLSGGRLLHRVPFYSIIIIVPMDVARGGFIMEYHFGADVAHLLFDYRTLAYFFVAFFLYWLLFSSFVILVSALQDRAALDSYARNYMWISPSTAVKPASCFQKGRTVTRTSRTISGPRVSCSKNAQFISGAPKYIAVSGTLEFPGKHLLARRQLIFFRYQFLTDVPVRSVVIRPPVYRIRLYCEATRDMGISRFDSFKIFAAAADPEQDCRR